MDFNDLEASFTKNNQQFLNLNDIQLFDEKFETIINSNIDADEFTKILNNEDFDSDVTWDAEEGEAESLGIEIEEILLNQDESFSDFHIFEEIIKEEEKCEKIQENLSEFLDFKPKSLKPNELKAYTCVFCNWSTSNRYYFRHHFNTLKHQNRVLEKYSVKDEKFEVELSDPKQLKSCNHCNLIFYSKKQLLDHNRKFHLFQKCQKCNRKFKDDKEFKLHMMRHRNANDLICGYCKKKFTNNQNLKRHERTHVEFKKFVCSLCDKNFGQKTNLLRHLKVHKNFA